MRNTDKENTDTAIVQKHRTETQEWGIAGQTD